MSQKNSLHVNVAGINSRSRVRFSDDEEPITDTNQTSNKIYVNILLENSASIIGFVLIKGIHESLTLLSNIRKCINSQFDEEQLQSLGNDTFKFLRNSIPISKKQESIINVSEITISKDANAKDNNIENNTETITNIDITETNKTNNFFDTKRRSSRSLSPKKSLKNISKSLQNISIEYSPQTATPNTVMATPNFEAIPHHFQYMSGSTATMPPPTHLAPATPSNDNKKLQLQQQQRNSALIVLDNIIENDTNNINDTYYNIMVRTSADTQYRYSTSFLSNTSDEQSIFGKFEDQNFDTLDYNNSAIRRSSKKSALFHKKIDLSLANITDKNMDKNMDKNTKFAYENINENKQNNSGSDSEVLDTPRSPNDKTQLELQFGGKLPKIRANKSTTKVLMINTQISNILANARINDDSSDTKNSRSKISRTNKSFVELLGKNNNINNDNIGNKNIFDEETNYKMNNFTSKELLKGSDKNIVSHIACRFTVIGSPHSTDANTKTQRIWQFYDPTELILGLQGVHHSAENPVWMDLVCDSDTFIMLSEHVRPSIHGLTIEDCITMDCREKLEMFDNYLFCCIRTTSIHNEEQSEKICIIVFKTMVLTYHLGKTSDVVINESRARLEKRHFGVKCPSPGWVAHTIIDVIVDRMIPEVECRVQEVQNIENLVFGLGGRSQYELLQRLQIARNWLTVYRSRLWPKSTMTHNFINTDWRQTFLSGVQQQYWNDINDHVARMVDLLSLGQSTLESCQNIFIAKISLEMADQSNQLSDSAGKITAVGSIFLPLSFFAALWGMNCKVPFQYSGTDEDFWGDSYYGFIIVFLLMILSAIVTYKYAMKFT